MSKKNNPFNTYLTKEQIEHKQICQWLAIQYPNLLWWHTPNESKKTPFERFLFSVMGGKKGVSDFIIIEPRGMYSGLAIELKAKGTKVFKKNGECYYPEQHIFLKKMQEKGFFATFAIGFDSAKNIIENYLKKDIE